MAKMLRKDDMFSPDDDTCVVCGGDIVDCECTLAKQERNREKVVEKDLPFSGGPGSGKSYFPSTYKER